MKRNLARLALAALLLAGSIGLHTPTSYAACQGVTFPLVPFAYETITVSSTAIGFTVATFAPTGGDMATYAYGTTENNSIRFRADGQAPTASEGHLVNAPSTFEVCGTTAIRKYLAIRTTADAVLKVTYYKGGN